MKRLQATLLVAMVVLFFTYAAFDIYAWPLSKFAENFMQGMWAVILMLIDPKMIFQVFKGETNEKDTPAVTTTTTTVV
jgi:hypothetical protein